MDTGATVQFRLELIQFFSSAKFIMIMADRYFESENKFFAHSFSHLYTRKHFFSVADPDPGSGIGYFFDPWIRDPGWEKSASGSEIRDPG